MCMPSTSALMLLCVITSPITITRGVRQEAPYSGQSPLGMCHIYRFQMAVVHSLTIIRKTVLKNCAIALDACSSNEREGSSRVLAYLRASINTHQLGNVFAQERGCYGTMEQRWRFNKSLIIVYKSDTGIFTFQQLKDFQRLSLLKCLKEVRNIILKPLHYIVNELCCVFNILEARAKRI